MLKVSEEGCWSVMLLVFFLLPKQAQLWLVFRPFRRLFSIRYVDLAYWFLPFFHLLFQLIELSIFLLNFFLLWLHQNLQLSFLIFDKIKARFEFLNLRNNKWIEKKISSTFFPKNWNQAILLMECKHAYEKIVDLKPRNGKIKSSTSSGIQVEMVFKNNELKSLYPLI